MSPRLPGVSSRIGGPAAGGFDIRQLLGDPAASPAGLGAVLPRMKDDTARKTAAAAFRRVFDALKAVGDSPDPIFAAGFKSDPASDLTKALAALAPRLNESEADEAVSVVLERGLSHVEPGLFNDPLQPLKVLCPRMSRAGADAAGKDMAAAAAKNRLPNAAYVLVGGFDAVAPRMDADAARAVAQRLFEAWGPDDLDAPMVEILLARMDGETAHRLAAVAGPKLLARFVAGGYSPGMAFMVSQEDFPGAFRKVTARLGRQELVELLKEPASAGEAEAIVLEHLGRLGNRKFDNVWDFVEWADTNDPSLHLRSAPTAPEPQLQPPVPPAFNPVAPG